MSRLNPESEWQLKELPELRIVDEAAWNAARERQERLDKTRSKREALDVNGLSASQSLRRRKFLLSGLLRCGLCGGSLTVAGSGESKRYYCANSKEKGKSVCQGLPGVPVRQAEEHVIGLLRDHLMNEAAYASFRASFVQKWNADLESAGDILRVKDQTIARLEKERANLLAAVKRGIADDELLTELETVGKSLTRAKMERDLATPTEVPLPDNLPELYHTHVKDLIATLTEEGVVSRATDLVHDLVDSVVVRYEPGPDEFVLALNGNIATMFNAANPAAGGAYVRMARSLKLVAGAGSKHYFSVSEAHGLKISRKPA